MKVLNESRVPKVGPFYLINGICYADNDDITEVELRGDFKDSDNSHYDYWKFLGSYYNDFKNVDYDYYPRGRVIYNSKEDMYYIYLDKDINNEDSISEIIYEFNIPKNKYKVDTDEHYQCHLCNNEYVGIFENISN